MQLSRSNFSHHIISTNPSCVLSPRFQYEMDLDDVDFIVTQMPNKNFYQPF